MSQVIVVCGREGGWGAYAVCTEKLVNISDIDHNFGLLGWWLPVSLCVLVTGFSFAFAVPLSARRPQFIIVRGKNRFLEVVDQCGKLIKWRERERETRERSD
jgi:hypothetical protein